MIVLYIVLIIAAAVLLIMAIDYVSRKSMCDHYWGDIKEGYQHCTRCNEAKAAPPKPCEHVWEKEQEYSSTTVETNIKYDYIYIYKCKKCGVRRKTNLQSGHDWTSIFEKGGKDVDN